MTQLIDLRRHALVTTTPDGRDLANISGIVRTEPIFQGTAPSSPGNWRREDVRFDVPSLWLRVDDVVPMVYLASIENQQTAVNAGWAVDDVQWATNQASEFPPRFLVTLTTRLAVRDSDGIINRLAYYVTIVGDLASL